MKKVILILGILLLSLNFVFSAPAKPNGVDSVMIEDTVNISWNSMAGSTFYTVCFTEDLNDGFSGCVNSTSANTDYLDSSAGTFDRRFYEIWSGNATGQNVSETIIAKENYTIAKTGSEGTNGAFLNFYINVTSWARAKDILTDPQLNGVIAGVFMYNATTQEPIGCLSGNCPSIICTTACNWFLDNELVRAYQLILYTNVTEDNDFTITGPIFPPVDLTFTRKPGSTANNWAGLYAGTSITTSLQLQTSLGISNVSRRIFPTDDSSFWDQTAFTTDISQGILFNLNESVNSTVFNTNFSRVFIQNITKYIINYSNETNIAKYDSDPAGDTIFLDFSDLFTTSPLTWNLTTDVIPNKIQKRIITVQSSSILAQLNTSIGGYYLNESSSTICEINNSVVPVVSNYCELNFTLGAGEDLWPTHNIWEDAFGSGIAVNLTNVSIVANDVIIQNFTLTYRDIDNISEASSGFFTNTTLEFNYNASIRDKHQLEVLIGGIFEEISLPASSTCTSNPTYTRQTADSRVFHVCFDEINKFISLKIQSSN